MVVNDHVAGAPAVSHLGEAAIDAAQVAADRPRLQRRGLRGLAQLAALVVAQRAAEVLGLADDRGVGHARQAEAHLVGDRAQLAADHRRDDGVDGGAGLGGGHAASWAVRTSGPVSVAVAVHPGGTTTVVSRWWRIAGPLTGSPIGSRS